ncbi:MAG: S8 family serine peptidase, partial [Myxococcota bacterium]|nr:S8 family serine peptidase [Myxococcota bacterium]
MKRHSLTLVPLLCACGEPRSELTLQDVEAYLDREVMVSVDDLGDGVARMEIEEAYGLLELDHVDAIGVSRLYIAEEDTSVKDMARLLEDDHRVDFAEPNYLVHTTSVSDPFVSYQWNLSQARVSEAWSYGTGSGITVAVLDTGVQAGGEDGIDRLLDGRDFYYGSSSSQDRVGHGTFVAGTIAQSTDNDIGVAGIAPDVSILPVKVMSDEGYGDISAIANGIVWATDKGAHVINMSLGSPYSSQALEQACAYAYDAGTVLIGATGNEFASSISYPAAYETVIAVGASRYGGSRASYSNYGYGIDILAPGGDLSSDSNNDGYADGILQETIENGSWTYTFWEGTSMAAPHVAAAAALVMDQGVTDPSQVYSILTETAVDMGSNGYDAKYGYGLLDITAAVQLAATGSFDSSDPDTSEADTSDTADQDTSS